MKNHFWSVAFVNLLVSALFGSIFYALFQSLGRFNNLSGGDIAGIVIFIILIFAIGGGISTAIGAWAVGSEERNQSFVLANFFLYLIMTILVIMGRFMLAAS